MKTCKLFHIAVILSLVVLAVEVYCFSRNRTFLVILLLSQF